MTDQGALPLGGRLTLLSTGEHECPYLPERTARTSFVDPRLPVNDRLYRILLDENFRRSGNYLYRPACPGCRACQTLRIPVQDFRLRRRHRRCLRRNAEVEAIAVAGEFRDEHYELYARYVGTRHAGGSMDDPTPQAYRAFLLADWCPTELIELREHGALLGVAVTDRIGDSLSAVYTFYDPRLQDRGLGMLAILRQLERARALGCRWLYLGYWIEGCERMTYKADYRPHEVFAPSGWSRIEVD